MTAVKDYRLTPGTTGAMEQEAAAVILVHAARAKRIVVELSEAGASEFSVAVAAGSQILQQQIGEALRDGRLTINYPDGES